MGSSTEVYWTSPVVLLALLLVTECSCSSRPRRPERLGSSRALTMDPILLDTNTAHIRRVDCPQEDAILVTLDRLRRCPPEVGDEFWPPDKKAAKRASKKPKSKTAGQPGGAAPEQKNPPSQPPAPDRGHQISGGVTEQPAELKWAGHLRSHRKRSAVEDD